MYKRQVEISCIDSLHVNIVTIDMVLELALLRVVVINRIDEILVEIVPLLEGKLLAEYTWRDVSGDEEMCIRDRGNLFADFKDFNLEDLAAERNEAALASQDNNCLLYTSAKV